MGEIIILENAVKPIKFFGIFFAVFPNNSQMFSNLGFTFATGKKTLAFPIVPECFLVVINDM